MNDEIKEIVNRLEKIGYYASVPKELAYMTTNITPQECKTILDYITNLQQENERLKELINPKTQIFIDTQDMEERYGEELYKEYLEKQVKDYKSRIEKAINKVQDIIDIGFDYDGYNDVDNLKKIIDELVRLADETKNILNGRSDE